MQQVVNQCLDANEGKIFSIEIYMGRLPPHQDRQVAFTVDYLPTLFYRVRQFHINYTVSSGVPRVLCFPASVTFIRRFKGFYVNGFYSFFPIGQNVQCPWVFKSHTDYSSLMLY